MTPATKRGRARGTGAGKGKSAKAGKGGAKHRDAQDDDMVQFVPGSDATEETVERSKKVVQRDQMKNRDTSRGSSFLDSEEVHAKEDDSSPVPKGGKEATEDVVKKKTSASSDNSRIFLLEKNQNSILLMLQDISSKLGATPAPFTEKERILPEEEIILPEKDRIWPELIQSSIRKAPTFV